MYAKTQFVEELCAAQPDTFKTKASAEKAFDAFCEIMAKGMENDGSVRLPNVGTFTVKERAARTGRNPQTGESITIPAKKVVKYTAAKALNEALNK